MKDLAFPRHGTIASSVIVAPDPDWNGPAKAVLIDPLKRAGDRSVPAFVDTTPWDSFPDASGKRNQRWYEGQPVEILVVQAAGPGVPRRRDGMFRLRQPHACDRSSVA